MHRSKRQGWGPTVILGLSAFATTIGVRPVSATEPMGDLNVQLRVVETVPGSRAAGPEMTGVARIDVFVDALRAASDIQLNVVRPDGAAWVGPKGSFTPGKLDWSDPSGAPVRLGSRGPSVQSRGAIRTRIVVPLNGAGVHEIAVTVTGLSEGKPIETEGMVRVALGVAGNGPVDDGEYAHFSLQEVK